MKTLKFLAMAFLFLAVGFFMDGCASGNAKLRLQIRQDVQENVKPLANRISALEQEERPDLRPFQNQVSQLALRLDATEASLKNLQDGVTIAVQTSAAAKTEANRAGELAAGALKKADQLEKRINTQSASSSSLSQLKQQLGARAFITGEQIAVLPLKNGSAEISEKQKMDQIAFMEKHNLVVNEVIGVHDRKPPKADSESEAFNKNEEVAKNRIVKAKDAFKKYLKSSPSDRTSPAPSELPDFPGGVILVLGRP